MANDWLVHPSSPAERGKAVLVWLLVALLVVMFFALGVFGFIWYRRQHKAIDSENAWPGDKLRREFHDNSARDLSFPHHTPTQNAVKDQQETNLDTSRLSMIASQESEGRASNDDIESQDGTISSYGYPQHRDLDSASTLAPPPPVATSFAQKTQISPVAAPHNTSLPKRSDSLPRRYSHPRASSSRPQSCSSRSLGASSIKSSPASDRNVRTRSYHGSRGRGDPAPPVPEMPPYVISMAPVSANLVDVRSPSVRSTPYTISPSASRPRSAGPSIAHALSPTSASCPGLTSNSTGTSSHTRWKSTSAAPPLPSNRASISSYSGTVRLSQPQERIRSNLQSNSHSNSQLDVLGPGFPMDPAQASPSNTLLTNSSHVPDQIDSAPTMTASSTSPAESDTQSSPPEMLPDPMCDARLETKTSTDPAEDGQWPLMDTSLSGVSIGYSRSAGAGSRLSSSGLGFATSSNPSSYSSARSNRHSSAYFSALSSATLRISRHDSWDLKTENSTKCTDGSGIEAHSEEIATAGPDASLLTVRGSVPSLNSVSNSSSASISITTEDAKEILAPAVFQAARRSIHKASASLSITPSTGRPATRPATRSMLPSTTLLAPSPSLPAATGTQKPLPMLPLSPYPPVSY